MEFAELWKKESNCTDAQYIEIFYTASDSFTITNRMPTTKNNVISSEHIRATESKDFVYLTNPEIWIDMMDHCNASVRFAEIGSEQTSIAYENRSKWFYLNGMLKHCLVDIDLAKSGNCPRTLFPILEERQRNCARAQAQLRMSLTRESSRPSLSFAPDSGIPGFADVLQIQHNEEFGYHVIAKCDIDVGKTVVVEECFTSCTFTDQKGCATCQRVLSNFIPCERCTSVQFCDEHCKKKNLFHVHECGIKSNMPSVGPFILGGTELTTQSILIAMSTFSTVESLMEFVETLNAEGIEMPFLVRDPKDKYRMFLKLHTSFSNDFIPHRFVLIAQLSYTYLMRLSAVKKFFVNESQQRFLMHLVLKHAIVQKNGFANLKDGIHQSQMLYTGTASFNHSCAPNLLNSYYNDQVCKTVRPIKKGQQLFICYLDNVEPTTTRQNMLRVGFGFDCECEKCKPQWKSCDREEMKSSNYYQYMKKNQHKAYEDDKTRSVLKQVCERFLNKYGRFPWCPEIGFIVDLYEKYFLYEVI